MALVTRQQAIDHLRLPLADSGSPSADTAQGGGASMERDLRMKIDQASGLILDYLKVSLTSPPDWDADAGNVPLVIQLGTLVQLAELWRFRGDDPASVNDAPQYPDGQLSPQVTNYLRRWRDPAIA